MKKVTISLLSAMALFAASCDKGDDPITPQPTSTKTAYITTKVAPVPGQKVGFNFATDTEVKTIDSTLKNWDFSKAFTTMRINSNASGVGNAGVQILDIPFSTITSAPETGYAYDTTATKLAVKGSSWYIYNATTHSFAPIAGKTFVFKTAEGNYAKMEILEALPVNDSGAVVTPPTMPTQIKYKFNYNYQPNGSRNF